MAKRVTTKETLPRGKDAARSPLATGAIDRAAQGKNRKDEAGMALKLLEELEADFPNNPRKQWAELMKRMSIESMIGRKRELSINSRKLYLDRGNIILNDLQVREVNIRLQNISEFGKKAAYKVIKYWATTKRALQEDPDSASSLANLTTVARRICTWNGYPHAVPKSLPKILKELGLDPDLATRQYMAAASKSPRGKGIDPEAIVQKAHAEEELFGLQCEGALRFGFREREMLEFRPEESDLGDRVHIFRGVKNGNLSRFVEIKTPEQRVWLDRVKAYVRRHRHEKGILTFQPMRDIDSSLEHLKYLCGKIGLKKNGKDGEKVFGVTFHGLRHQFAQDMYKRETGGYDAPVVSGIPVPKEIDREARQKVTNALGHHRISVTGAYLGVNAVIPFPQRRVMDAALARFEDGPADVIRGYGITRLVLAGKIAEGILDPADMTACAWEGSLPSDPALIEDLHSLLEKTTGTRCFLVAASAALLRGETLEVV